MHTKQSNPPGAPHLAFRISGALLVLLLCNPVYAQPANDNCANAALIPSSAPTPPYTAPTVDTTTATLDPADPLTSCNGNDGPKTIWYEYTPDTTGTVNFTTAGSTRPGGAALDTAIGVYTGACGAAQVEVGCADNGLNDDLIMDVDAGVTYRIKVGEFAGGVGGGNVVFSVDEPPEPIQFNLESVRDGISPPISSLGPLSFYVSRGANSKAIEEVPNVIFDVRSSGVFSPNLAGPVLEAADNSPLSVFSASNLLQIFEGIENDNNDNLLGRLIYPPDTNGDVGPDHYVQMGNLLTTIFDKSGNVLVGPIPTNAFFAGLGGQCQFTNSGDPIVLYDEETDRWLVSQFASGNPQDGLCVAISTTGDPTGTYYQHEFDFTGIGFPDYPKYGFATDSINVMVNLFTPFQGAGLGAIDKAEAMSAGPTTMVFYIMGAAEFGFVPGDNDGPVFDNTLPTFFTNNGASGHRIDVFEITPDFAVPANSTIAEVARIPVAPFDSDLCSATRERCIDQPNSAPRLEAITDRLMFRAQTRDNGKRKTAVVTHTVDVDGTGKAGVRWYEFWNDRDHGWKLKKENTFSPDGDHRWMPSIAMTAKGQTCLGYSVSSTETYTSIAVAGRNGTSNHMNAGEFLVYDGNIDQYVQTGSAARWGDYSSMSIDPIDDTCWFTTEYASPNTRLGQLAGWATKIIQFKVPGAK